MRSQNGNYASQGGYQICELVRWVFHFVHVPVHWLQYKCHFVGKKNAVWNAGGEWWAIKVDLWS